jgi:hypothetical protein
MRKVGADQEAASWTEAPQTIMAKGVSDYTLLVPVPTSDFCAKIWTRYSSSRVPNRQENGYLERNVGKRRSTVPIYAHMSPIVISI